MTGVVIWVGQLIVNPSRQSDQAAESTDSPPTVAESDSGAAEDSDVDSGCNDASGVAACLPRRPGRAYARSVERVGAFKCEINALRRKFR